MNITQIVRKMTPLENKTVTVKLTPKEMGPIDEPQLKGVILTGTLHYDERKDIWSVTSAESVITFGIYDVNTVNENPYKSIEIHVTWND